MESAHDAEENIVQKESLVEKNVVKENWTSFIPFDKVKKQKYKPPLIISYSLQLNKYGNCMTKYQMLIWQAPTSEWSLQQT